MRTAALALVCAASLAVAGQFRIGTRFVLDMDSQVQEINDSSGHVIGRLVDDDMYYGLGFTAQYDPLRWLSIRATVAEVRFLKQGGEALILFPTLGGDVVVAPPVRWRLTPTVRIGGTWADYAGIKDTLDGRMAFPTSYNLRAGFGVRFHLNDRIDLEADTDIWEHEANIEIAPYMLSESGYTAIGLGQAHLGATFRIPSL